MQDTIHLKPKRVSFLISRVGGVAVACAVVAAALVVASAVQGTPLLAVVGAGQFLVLVGFAVFAGLVAYEKERYELHQYHLVVHRGGLFSTQTTELDLKNVTHVKQHLHWIRYRFFDVGDVIIESAGSSRSEAALHSIRRPDAIYSEVRNRLRLNGFALSSDEVLLEARPAMIGVVLECVGRGGGALAGIAWLLGSVVAAVLDRGDTVPWLVPGLAAVGVVSVVAAITATVLHFFDLRRRTYTVTGDAVVYEEGFLNRDNAFIPFENIADANIRKTLVDQIIGLSDVRVSCQGGGSEVAFRRLAEGAEISAALRRLVSDAADRQEAARVAEKISAPLGAGESPHPSLTTRRRSGFMPVPADRAWTGQLKMNPVRAAAGVIWLLPLFPLWILATLISVVRALATTYRVDQGSVSMRFRLIGERETSFAYDKISGVIVSRNPFDLLFDTMTIRFISIGSDSFLELAHVATSDVDLVALRRQAGIPDGASLAAEHASFDPVVWVQSALVGIVGIGTLALVASLAAVLHHIAWALVLPALFTWIAAHFIVQRLRAQRQVLTFHPGHVELRAGIFIRTHTLVRYDNVKKTQVVRYPGSRQGRLVLFVAGEIRIQKKGGPNHAQQNHGGVIRPCTVEVLFLSDIDAKRTSIDALLRGDIRPETVDDFTSSAPLEVLGRAQPALANTVLASVVLGLIFPPLWLAIPLLVLMLKRREYRVEPNRVVVEDGILYRRHTSVLFDRIDSLKQGQGPLNKLFGNGRITLFTAGSSTPDLTLSDLPGHGEIYRLIRAHYGFQSGESSGEIVASAAQSRDIGT